MLTYISAAKVIYKNNKIKAIKEFIIARFPCVKDKLSLKNNCTTKIARDTTNKNNISFKTFWLKLYEFPNDTQYV